MKLLPTTTDRAVFTLDARWQERPLREAGFAYLLRSPVAFQEFFFPDPTPYRPDQLRISEYDCWRPDNHCQIPWSQYPLFLEQVGLFVCGRGCNKTEGAQNRDHIRRAIVWRRASVFSFIARDDLVRKNLMEPVLEIVEKHPVLSQATEQPNRVNRFVTFRNGSMIFWKSPGLQSKDKPKAEGFQSSRNTAMAGDEAQNFTRSHLEEANPQQLVDPFDPEHQANRGAAYRLMGVPNGLRDQPFYQLDTDPKRSRFYRHVRTRRYGDKMIKFVWHIPSLAMFWNNRDRHETAFKDTGSDPQNGFWSERYKQEIWGLWGRPASTLFPYDLRARCCRQIPDFRHIVRHPTEFLEEATRKGEIDPTGNIRRPGFEWLEPLMPMERQGALVGFGIDVGQSTSTCISAFYFEDGVWVWFWLLELRDWRNGIWQCFVVDYLTQRYQPAFIGMDRSTLGAVIYDPLRTLPQFRAADYNQILKGFHTTERPVWSRRVDQEKLARARNERERRRIMAHPEEEREAYPAWTMMNIRAHLEQGTMALPPLDEALDIHNELGSITRSVVRDINGNYRTEFGPKHPHTVSSLQAFCGGLRKWELERGGGGQVMLVKRVPHYAHSELMLQVMGRGIR